MPEDQLAIHGGQKVKETPFGTGKRFGIEEAQQLLEALEQNTLFYHHGRKVKEFLNAFNELYGVKHSVATSSGTAAIHVALGAAGVTVGDEVITSPITDQGTLIGILYQNAIPVFADLNPHTYNMDPRSIEARISKRTKAIVVVHLAGNPCDMDEIMDIARRYGVTVIEDCAQAYCSWYKGKLVGTIGDYGCFSTNDFKQISTGDGGIVTINSGNDQEYLVAHAFADKNYKRFSNSVDRNLSYLAPNYRMTELQGAVGIAQLRKLTSICEKRSQYGEKITEGIKGLPGVYAHHVENDCRSSYWFYMFRVNESELTCSRNDFSKALEAEGIPNQAGYIPDVVYMQPMFQNREAYVGSHFPFELSDVKYERRSCAVAEQILATAIRINISEFYSQQDIDDIVRGISKVATYYRK